MLSEMGWNEQCGLRELREEVIPFIQPRVDRREIELPELALKCLCFEQGLGWSPPEVPSSLIFPVILTLKLSFITFLSALVLPDCS